MSTKEYHRKYLTGENIPPKTWPEGSQAWNKPLYYKVSKGRVWMRSTTDTDWFPSSKTIAQVEALQNQRYKDKP